MVKIKKGEIKCWGERKTGSLELQINTWVMGGQERKFSWEKDRRFHLALNRLYVGEMERRRNST